MKYIASQFTYQNKRWLEEQYLNSKKNTYNIAKKCGCSQKTIWNWLVKFGISMRARGEATHLSRLNHSLITPELLEIINGQLLSDACVYQQSHYSAIISWGQKHLEYTEYIKNILANFGIYGGKISKQHIGEYVAYQFRTCSYEGFLLLREKWYPDGKKAVPRDIKLTPATCLHWYLGDGYLNSNNLRSYIILSTNGFIREDTEFLGSALNKMGFETHMNRRASDQYVICLPPDATKKFLGYIGTCPIKCYSYKWNYQDNRKIPGISLSAPKSVLQYDLSGKFINEFSSIMEAEKITNINHGGIIKVCKGELKTAGNAFWRYA